MLRFRNLAFLVVAACGPTTPANPDSGLPVDSGIDAPILPTATARRGKLFAIDTKMQGGAESGGVTMVFQQTNNPACVSRMEGACSVLRCDLADAGTIAFTNLNAGTVTISGGSEPVKETPGSNGAYVHTGLDSFSPGAAVTIVATGGDVAPFTASLTFPSAITVTMPSGKPVIDHTAGFPIAWTGSAPKVLVLVSEYVKDRSVEVMCLFEGGPGSAMVPATATKDFEAATMLGSGGGEADVSIFGVDGFQLSPSGLPLTIAVGSGSFSALPDVK